VDFLNSTETSRDWIQEIEVAALATGLALEYVDNALKKVRKMAFLEETEKCSLLGS
jgi:hypothetical protein